MTLARLNPFRRDGIMYCPHPCWVCAFQYRMLQFAAVQAAFVVGYIIGAWVTR